MYCFFPVRGKTTVLCKGFCPCGCTCNRKRKRVCGVDGKVYRNKCIAGC